MATLGIVALVVLIASRVAKDTKADAYRPAYRYYVVYDRKRPD